ncbi:MAG: glycosyltransferase [Bacteroidaceae bacterium]|nr:glycosyltransferase [Bacteroidaceae bacterium]
MKWLNNIRLFGKATHTCKVWYHLLRVVLPHQQANMTIEEAEHIMAQHYADQGTTCVKQNTIEAQPEYDLEIIVPVYNAAEYLEACIASITSQATNFRFHTTFINDGSTDRSADILKQHEHDAHITVLTQSNRGVSAARNQALAHINARYVMFVDADDLLPQDAINNLMEEAYEQNADVVEGSIATTDGTTEKLLIQHTDSNDAHNLTGYVCSKVFAARLFEHIGFPEGYRYEDTILSFLLYPMAHNMATISPTTYLYRQHDSSFTSGEQGNYAILDAYWVVRQLIGTATEYVPAERHNLVYEAFLTGMKLSGNRMMSLDRATCMAYFAAMCELASRHFPTLTITSADKSHQALAAIDEALKNKDFTHYLLASNLL